MTQQVKEKVLHLLRERLEARFNADEQLRNMGMDSLDHLEMTMEIEEELRIEITDQEISDHLSLSNTPNQMAEYLANRGA